MLERQVSVALEGGHGVEDDLEKAFDSELLRIVQFYQKKASSGRRDSLCAIPMPSSHVI